MAVKGKNRKTRRQFLNESCDFLTQMILAQLSLGVAGTKRAHASTPSGKQRRHFINVGSTARAGWDSYYFHQGMTSADYVPIQNSTWMNSFCTYTLRYQDTQAQQFGGAGGPSIGQGMCLVLQAMASINRSDSFFVDAPNFVVNLGDLLIWKGMTSTSAHGIAGRMVQEGALSSYAGSYSSIISCALAQSPDYVRKLHYVQAVGAPGEMSLQSGFITGYGIPINIGDLPTWTAMTSSATAAPGSYAALMQSATAQIDQILASKSYTIPQTQQTFASYGASYSSYLSVAASNYATSTAFTNILNRYTAVLNRVLAIVAPQIYTPGPSGQNTGNYNYSGLASATQSFNASSSNNNLAGRFGGVANIPGYNAVYFQNQIFGFALTEFLIKNDLSAVVDTPYTVPDCHADMQGGVYSLTVAYILYLELLNGLKSADAGMGDGSTVLDHTSVIFQNEFDRESNCSSTVAGPPLQDPGLNHGVVTSVVLAGYGVQLSGIPSTPRFVGDIMTGRYNNAGFNLAPGPYGPYFNPLPIDSSGNPSPGGTIYDPQAILPTMCAVFGTQVPQQQFTGEPVCTPILKAS